MKPLIGITTAWSVETWGDSIEDRGYNYVGRPYVEAITNSGGIPILIPQINLEDIDIVLNSVDGLLFSGGGDAKRFSKKDLPSLKEQQPLRYEFESMLMKAAYDMKKPILGICRGFQMMIEVFGGSLSTEVIDGHKQNLHGSKPWHKVSIKEGSFFYKVTKDLTWNVNSFHIQRVEKVPELFTATVIADDGVIEAIESNEGLFIVGTQFHPEELTWGDKKASLVFEEFLKSMR